jgi:translation initiation factor IF-3
VQFRGREIAHTDLGRKLLIRFSEDLAPYGTAEGTPRLEGRNAHVLLSPVKASGHPPGKDKDKPKPPEPGGGKPN